MKRLVIVLTTYIIVAQGFASTATIDGITWTYYVSGGKASVGLGSSAAISTATKGEISIPSTLGGKPVTSISSFAFSGCSGITNVIVPDCVTSIGAGAFSGCSGLNEITLPFVGSKRGNDRTEDSVFGYIFGTASYSGGMAIQQRFDSYSSSATYKVKYYIPTTLRKVVITSESIIAYGAFSGCSGITSVTIPNGVKYINNYGFSGCGLTSVLIPDSVKDICNESFACGALTNVIFAGNAPNASSSSFIFCPRNCTAIVLKSSVGWGVEDGGNWAGIVLKYAEEMMQDGVGWTIINGTLLKVNPNGVVKIAIPNSVEHIAKGAFSDCASLESMTIPDSILHVDVGAFNKCVSLSSVTIPQLVCSSGLVTMFPSSSISHVSVSDNVSSLGNDLFRGCTTIVSMTIPMLLDFGNNDLRNVGRLAEGKNGLWIQDGWLMGYIGESSAEVVVPEGVTGIASYAFEGQMGLERVRLPSTLKYIGVNAFMGCTALEEVEIPDGVEKIDNGAFKNCTWLQDLKLPQQLKIIGKEAFANCAMLPNLVCEEGLMTIGGQAFSNCWRMLSVSLPVSLTSVGANAFVDCKRITGVMAPTHEQSFATLFPSAYTNINTVVVPDGEWTLTTNAFKGCKLLSDITIPSTVTQVCASAFQDCTALTSITLPNDIEELGMSAFQGCIALENVKLPRSLKTIGNSAFRSCSALGELSLPNSVQEIGDYAFYGDAWLESINLPNALKSVGAYAFSGCSKVTAAGYVHGLHSIGAYAYQNCSSVRDVYIPSSVTNLGASIFYNCASITNIITATAHQTMASLFPKVYNTIEQIGIAPGETKVCDGCFSGCAAITEIGIPDSVTTMGTSAFSGCTKLARVSLSSQLAALPDYAFKNCSSLATLTIPEGVVSLGKNVFEGCSKLESLYFVGNAPAYDAAVFSGIASGVTVFVVNGSMGWDGVATSRALPESWPTSNSRAITYWEPNRFDVVFDANGGLPESSVIEQITGMTYALPKVVPTKSGATFLGWWTEPVNGAQVMAGTQVTLTRAHTFYAHWAGNLYRVAFEANGGMGEMPEQTCMVGEVSELPLNVFARPGFAFVGWATEPDGAVVYVDGASVVDLTLESDASVVLYAVWDEKAWATGDYMNAPGRLFMMGEGDAWTSDVDVYHDGVGSMRSGKIGLESESTMSTTVVGEGVVSFWWKVSCEETYKGERYDYVAFCVDGVETDWMAGETDWTRATFEVVGSGSHTLTWIYHKDDWDEPDYDGDDCAWVDEFVWEPAAVTVTFDGNGNTAGAAPKAVVKYEGYSLTMPGAGTLERFSYVFGGWSDGKNVYAPGTIYVFTGEDVEFSAVWTEKIWTYADFLNCTNMLFTTSVGTEWFGDFSTNHDWVVSARSAAIEDGGTSWIQGVVSSAGTLSFWAKVSGEEKRGRMYDYLNVTVDGETVYSAANVDWTNVTVNITLSGAHTIRWTYMKDSSNSVGYDCAWLDEVTWTPSVATAGGDVGEKGTVEESGGGYVVEAKAGETLTEADFTFGVAKEAYVINIAAGGKSATVALKAPEVRRLEDKPPYQGGEIEEGVSEDAEDSSGVLASVEDIVAKHGESAIKAKPTPKSGETVGALPVKTYEGLYYQAAWGDDLGTMTQGEKVQATGDTLYLGVIKQKGNKGFYKITVSEQ